MRAPHLSILLPCRDAEPVLEECISSLQSQTLNDYEVLAVDDGSSDGTPARLAAWAAGDERVRVLEGEGKGIAAALSLAAAHARSDVLARMDADDIAHPERLERQWGFLRERLDLAACGAGVRYFPRERVGSGYERYEAWLNSLREPAELDRDLFVECPVAHPTLVVRAAALHDAGGYRDRGWPEDYDLLLRMHRRGHRLANLAAVLLSWRITGRRLSAVSAAFSADAFRRCKVHHLLRGYLPEGRAVVVWGAGRVGKPLARELLRHQLQPAAFVDLDPRKVDQVIHGATVRPPSYLEGPSARRPFVLVAVGAPGARDEIRVGLSQMGYSECADYRALA